MAEPGGRCVVIGGGLAGLAASVWLAEAGQRVTLLERRGSLGGRTHAINVASIADVADNGQHIMVPGFVNLMRYLDTIGTRQHMRWEPIAARDRDGAQLVGNGIRNAAAFLTGRLPGCPRRDWPATLAAQGRIVRQSLRQPADLDSISVREWFDRVRMPASAREASWDLLAIGVLNEKCELASAKAFADIIATFVRLARSQRLPVKFGYPAVDFDTLYVDGARRLILERGGEIRHRAIARRVTTENGSVTGVLLDDGSHIAADSVICAVPAWDIADLLAEVPGHERIGDAAAALVPVPIISVNLYLDRELETISWLESLTGALGELEIVFDRQRMHPRSTENGFLYSLTTSAAYYLNSLSNDAITDVSIETLRKYYPAARDARVLHSHIVRMNRATFSQRPGTAGLRPRQATSVRGLALAGDWTQTEWPSTMESAVQSAARAVDIVLAQAVGGSVHRPAAVLVPA